MRTLNQNSRQARPEASSPAPKRERDNVFLIASEQRKKIRMKFEASDKRGTYQATRTFLKSHKARIAYVLKTAPQLDLDKAKEIATRVEPFRTEWDPISWYKHPKKTLGAYRPVCKFTIAHQATLKMIAAVLAAQWNRPRNLYGAASADQHDTNTGRDAAAKQVLKLLKDGYTYVQTADIKNAFGTIDPNALYSLPLSSEIIARTLDLRNQRFEEVDPPQHVARQKTRVGGNAPGEERVWMEYTVGLEKSFGGEGDPKSELGHTSTPEASPGNEPGTETPLRPDNSTPSILDNHDHAPSGREDAETRSQEHVKEQHHATASGPVDTPIDANGPTHSELRPHGLAQGSAASSIIFAMLLGELPKAKGDARFLICHDDIIVLARTPEARSRLIKTLTDFFANHSRAGSLTVEVPQNEQYDTAPFTWLGYTFDPGKLDHIAQCCGIGEAALDRIIPRLKTAEDADLTDLAKLGHNMASTRPCGFPMRTFHLLKRFRSGFGVVHHTHEDLQLLLELSQNLAAQYAERFQNPEVLELHSSIFEPATAGKSTRVTELLKQYPWKNDQGSTATHKG